MKKAQAAMEFLTTYGWVILVGLMAIFSLSYFGIWNPPVPGECFMSHSIPCTDFKITNSGVTIFIKNLVGYKIDQIGVSIGNCGSIAVPGELGPNAVASYTVPCTIVGSRFQGQLNFSYRNVETQISHNDVGKITDSLE